MDDITARGNIVKFDIDKNYLRTMQVPQHQFLFCVLRMLATLRAMGFQILYLIGFVPFVNRCFCGPPYRKATPNQFFVE